MTAFVDWLLDIIIVSTFIANQELHNGPDIQIKQILGIYKYI